MNDTSTPTETDTPTETEGDTAEAREGFAEMCQGFAAMAGSMKSKMAGCCPPGRCGPSDTESDSEAGADDTSATASE